VKKADYSKIAPFYDKGRSLSEHNIDLWLGIISKYTKAPEGARLLDLGCGTGRFAIPIATKLRFSVTGADSSKEMLVKAREKDITKLVKWDLEDAQSLSYSDNSFDIVFMSFLLHHCDNPDKVVCECRRVLNDPGVILIRHAGIEQIRDDVEHTFFPETLAIDEARIFSVRKMENCLKEGGFSTITSEEIVQRTFTTCAARQDAILLKNTSSLTMIPQEAFERGLKRLHDYVQKHPNDPWLLHERMTMTAGYKGRLENIL
jgi:ubiquinone/menaquinone biosynthesis C-methylase UbiE